MSCKKCSNKLILSEYSVFHLNFLCFVVHIELVSYLNHSRNTFASLHINYMFLHTLDLNRPLPLPLYIYFLSTTSLSIEHFPNIDSNASTTTIYQVFDHYQVWPQIYCQLSLTNHSSVVSAVGYKPQGLGFESHWTPGVFQNKFGK
jgi:hypothetical protein